MGHRHLFSTPQMFGSEHDQNWNHMHIEQPYANLAARTGPADNGSFFYPPDSMSVDGVHFAPQWNPAPTSSAYISSSHSMEVSHYQTDASGPSYDPFVHSSTAGTFCTDLENHSHQSPSSDYDRQEFHGVGGGLDLAMGNGRGPHKRKSPGVPSTCEVGSTSRYNGAGSSSDLPLSSDLRQEKPNLDPQYMAWECVTLTPAHRGNPSIRPESSLRNVRSRPALDLEPSLARTNLSSNSSHSSYPAIHPFEQSNTVDFSGQNSSGLMHDWSHTRMSPAPRRMLVSDPTGYSHETSHFLGGSSTNNASVDAREYHHNFASNRNPVIPQSSHSALALSARGIRSSHSQRPTPTFRASSSSSHLGHVVPSDDGMPFVAENLSSRQPRMLSNVAWRNGDGNGRSRISYDRYRFLSNEPGRHDRFSSEGFMVVDRSAFYGYRNMLDQHRDMRLDIDNMSYEELLALGERIGSVSTGLSEDLILKCLTETIYCCSGQSQDEGTCVICLEEYKNMDDVGSLNICGHDYHVSCIKKWLSMKNSCPICKSSVMADNMKE